MATKQQRMANIISVDKKARAFTSRASFDKVDVPTNGNNHIESSNVVIRTVTVAPRRPPHDTR